MKEELEKSGLVQLVMKPNGFILIICAYFLWYFLTEILLTFLVPGEWAAITWVPLHFVVNPILSFILSILVMILSIRSKQLSLIVAGVSAFLIMNILGYAGITGDVWIVEVCGMRFRQ